MQHYTYCTKHLDKIIFYSIEAAEDFILRERAGENFQPYVCPATKNHYHIRDRVKRNARRWQSKKKNRY